jgi:hypothetical protein
MTAAEERRATFEGKLDEYRTYQSTTNIISYGGAGKVVCPLCTNEHPICVFAAGSLYCVNPDCGNPHHRTKDKSQVVDANMTWIPCAACEGTGSHTDGSNAGAQITCGVCHGDAGRMVGNGA